MYTVCCSNQFALFGGMVKPHCSNFRIIILWGSEFYYFYGMYFFPQVSNDEDEEDDVEEYYVKYKNL